jgi:hypothetical protein
MKISRSVKFGGFSLKKGKIFPLGNKKDRLIHLGGLPYIGVTRILLTRGGF